MRGLFPIVHELSPMVEAVDVFRSLSVLPHCLFLDSAVVNSRLGRYSYVAADPFQFLSASLSDPDPLQQLSAAMSPWRSNRIEGLPIFQGGGAGLLSYDLGATLERIPWPRYDDFQLPRLAFGLYDTVIAFDHRDSRAWIVSQGWPEQGGVERERRAQERLQFFRRLIENRTSHTYPSGRVVRVNSPVKLSVGRPHHAISVPGDLWSNFNEREYCRAVERVIGYIYAGDIFQANLSQRLIHPAQRNSLELYLALRQANPAPFAGYFDLGEFQIVSASPERFLQVDGRGVETRPIKGTRPRRQCPEADLFAGDEMQQSEKDRAENIMIVDLMRNDLSRVCEPDSIHVTQLCEIENYQYVQHLVSAVVGQLASDYTTIDLLRAAFPGGSITGAPKIRAMEIIAEIEPHARGAYCGSLGYLNWDGSMDLSILIRTITAGRGWWQLQVGGGIVAQSDPQREYAETWHKAEGLLRALPTGVVGVG